MTTGQKIIKGLGISLAIFLIISIIGFIFMGIASFFGFLEFEDKEINPDTNKNLIIQDNYNIQNIDIELSYTKLIIKEGQELKAETNNNEIKITEEDRKLIIEEEKRKILTNYKNYEVIIYIPEDKVFNEVDIDAGAGKLEIDTLRCYDLDLKLGAGSVNINNLVALNRSKIEGGAGSINIKDGSLNNPRLDMGVGKFTLTSKLTGKTIIDAGVGAMEIKILGAKTDYQVKVDKGIGSIIYDNEKLKDEEVYGIGNNLIDIDGGIGKITIDFQEK